MSWQVTLISRQPMMDPKTRRQKKIVRRISNEEGLLQALQRRPGVSARLVDLASLTLMDQLTLITQTDILVGEDLPFQTDILVGEDPPLQAIFKNKSGHTIGVVRASCVSM